MLVVEPDLCRGIVFAILKASGYRPVTNDLSKIISSGKIKPGLNSLSSSFKILSNPLLVLFGNLFMVFSSSTSVTGSAITFHYFFLNAYNP